MTPTSDLESLVGRVLDERYRLDALLGQGGMGAVFRAYHLAMDRKVAIKVLRPHLVGDAVAARRFAREAKGTFKIGSDHAVRVHDFAIEQAASGAPPPRVTDPSGAAVYAAPLAYMVMEYLDGRTVGAELSVDGAFAPPRAIHVMRQVCDALDAAHRLGLVHRDIKPDNIMLQVRGSDPDFAKVLDFGLAKLADNASSAPFSVAAITQGDIVFGTPDYMSPEQAKGQPLDGRSDFYAIGVTMFEMLTGRCPFVEPTAILLLARHVQAPPPRLIDVAPGLAGVPGIGAVEAVIARLLAKAPGDRPPNAQACIAELDAAASALAGRGLSPRDDRNAASTMDLDPPPAQPRPSMPSVFLPSPPRVIDPIWSESDSEQIDALHRRKRGPGVAIAIAGLAVVAGVIVAIAAKHGPPAHAIATPPPGPIAIDAGAIAAGVTDAAPIAQAAPDAAAAAVPDAGAAVAIAPPQMSPAAAHVAAAEAAHASGNHIKQLTEADLAVRKDPHNAEARFLLGDALVTGGDIQNGCQYLHSVKRLAKARAAAAAAGCPER